MRQVYNETDTKKSISLKKNSQLICKKYEKMYHYSTLNNNKNNKITSHILKNEVCRNEKSLDQQAIPQEFLKIS